MSTKFVALVLLSLVAASMATALDDYVNKPDAAYKYSLVNSIRGSGFTTYNINLTSQSWSPPGGVSYSVWTHWLQICVPDNVRPHSIFPDSRSTPLCSFLPFHPSFTSFSLFHALTRVPHPLEHPFRTIPV